MRKSLKISTIVVIASLLAGMLILYLTVGKNLIQGQETSLISFFYTHASGYLFFIVSPVELLFISMLYTDFNIAIIILFAVIGAIGSQIIDYAIGFLVSNHVIEEIIGLKRYLKYKDKIETHGGWVIFLFNFLPLSSPILLLVAGMVKYSLKKALFYSIIGLLLKYIIITILVLQFNYTFDINI